MVNKSKHFVGFSDKTAGSAKKTLLDYLASFLNSSKYDTTYLTHGIHPYPAKYIPQLPRTIIMQHTNERNTILDPFCGSGTSLLEATLLGRKSIGIDSNPIAALISRAKTRALKPDEIEVVKSILLEVSKVHKTCELPTAPYPSFPRIHHWFQENVIHELAWLKSIIEKVRLPFSRDFLFCAFSSIIVSVSNQESDTRYAAKSKNIPDGYALKRFCKKLNKEIKNIEKLSSIKAVRKNTPIIYNLDARVVDKEIIPDNSIDLIVTSPPYLNSYDYYLYHKLRMFWLGYEPDLAKNLEIGSRNEHSSRKAPINVFEEKLLPIMDNISRVLKPSKMAYFFVGDAIMAGNFINMKEVFCKIAKKTNLRYVADTKYLLERVTRSFHEKRLSVNRNNIQKMQHILAFEGVAQKGQILLSDRVIASPKASWKLASLNGSIADGSQIAIKSNDLNRHIHSLGKYPSKFIPEIPRWALSQFSKPGDVILDPFVGSGTTAVEALLLSRNAISADISPYACLLVKAKTTRISKKSLLRHAATIESALSSTSKLPKLGRFRFDYDDFWFNTKYLKQIESIRHFILENIPPKLQKFFLAVLSTTIKPCSYLDESQIKVKRSPKKVLSGTPSPLTIMKNKLPKFVNNLIEFIELVDFQSKSIVIQDTANMLYPKYIDREKVDLVVTSPPYINAMNYPMTHRYENILLGLISFADNIHHQQEYFGTERVYSTDYSKLHLMDTSFSCAQYLNPKLEKIFYKERKRSFIAYKYFSSMYEAFKGIVETLKPGGHFVLVGGANTIRGVQIDTFKVLVSLLEDLGLNHKLSFHYEIIKHYFKLRRHETANIIKMDGVAVLGKDK